MTNAIAYLNESVGWESVLDAFRGDPNVAYEPGARLSEIKAEEVSLAGHRHNRRDNERDFLGPILGVGQRSGA